MARSTTRSGRRSSRTTTPARRNVLDNIRDGLLRQAIYAKLTKNITVPDSAIKSYYAKNKANYATPASRQIRHILVKDKALADKIYAQLARQRRAVRGARGEVRDRPGVKKTGGKLGSIQKGQTVPSFDKVAFSVATGKVAKPIKSSYGWHVIEATADTVPASQRPLDKALTAQIRTTLLNTKKQSVANKWFTPSRRSSRRSVRYAAGLAPPRRRAPHRRRQRRRKPRPADAAHGGRTCSEPGLLGAVLRAGSGSSGREATSRR